jgi:hypothetical protein
MNKTIEEQMQELIDQHGPKVVLDGIEQMGVNARLENRRDEALEIFVKNYFPSEVK